MRPFVHLHCHSHYSLLDGASPIGKLVNRAKSHGMNALALTDHGNLHGALEFYTKARDAGINLSLDTKRMWHLDHGSNGMQVRARKQPTTLPCWLRIERDSGIS